MGALVSPRDALHYAIAAACGRPMKWGVDDCCLWAASVVAKIIGEDPLAHERWRGYSTPLEAARRLGPGGLHEAVRAVAAARGWPSVKPDEADTGDVGVLVGPRYAPFGAAVAIRLDGWWVGRDDNGVGFLPSNAAAEAWRPLACPR